MKKKLLRILILLVMILTEVWIVCFAHFFNPNDIQVAFQNSQVEQGEIYQIFYTVPGMEEMEFDEQHVVTVGADSVKNGIFTFSIPYDIVNLRVDFGNQAKDISIENFHIKSGNKEIPVDQEKIETCIILNDITVCQYQGDTLKMVSSGEDPHIAWNVSSWNLQEGTFEQANWKNLICKIVAFIAVLLLAGLFWVKFDFFVEFPTEIYQSKKLIVQLSKNDFKTKYAGSYLGIIWAFVQPIVTVLVYWFVFEKGLRSSGIQDVPFILWLMAGLVPWFFFSDGLNGGTNALLEYQYLVKKVVFRIDILPIVKILSAFYVHFVFVVFMLVVYGFYGYLNSICVIQIIYYSFCLLVLLIGLSYITSAIVGFFRDLTQIISIFLQVGMWMTPIMWNFEGMGLPPILKAIFQLNPMFYIVQGYRDALISHVWFFERPGITLYFWIVTIAILGLGMVVFKKLKVHFADVL